MRQSMKLATKGRPVEGLSLMAQQKPTSLQLHIARSVWVRYGIVGDAPRRGRLGSFMSDKTLINPVTGAEL